MRVAFVVGLNDKKLAQKLAPLASHDAVERIDLYRRRRFEPPAGAGPAWTKKIRWMGRDGRLGRGVFGELRRICGLLARGGRYDLLVGCHQRFHGYYVFLAGLLHRKPVVQLTITDPAWIEALPGARTLLRRAAAVGFRGRTTLERHRRVHPEAAARQSLFALANAWTPPPMRSPEDMPEKTIDLLYVGYLAGYKDIPTWLRTVAALERPYLRAVLVGERPGPELRRLIDDLGIGAQLEFPGRLDGDALENIYARARVLLLTSRWEGLPQVALEAMAHGVPVVATDVGDLRDLIEPDVQGDLVPPGDPQAAAAAAAKLLDDEEAWSRASREARRSAEREAERGDPTQLRAIWDRVLHDLGLLES